MAGFNPLWAAGGGAAAGAAGGLHDIFSSLFPDASEAAMPDLEQIPGTIKPYYQPYVDAGQKSLSNLQGQYGDLMKDPGAIISRLGAGYKQSPGYTNRLNQAEGSINNAAAAGGMLGTPQHQQLAGEQGANIASEDYDKYLQQILGLFGTGLQGEQGLNEQGYQGTSELANSLANVLLNKSKLKYTGQVNQNQETGGLIGNILSMFSGGAKAAAGGGL